MDQRLKQLGLIGKKSRSYSRNSQSLTASQSPRSQCASPASSRGSSSISHSSCCSSRSFRGRSRSIRRQKSPGVRKSVKFESEKMGDLPHHVGEETEEVAEEEIADSS